MQSIEELIGEMQNLRERVEILENELMNKEKLKQSRKKQLQQLNSIDHMIKDAIDQKLHVMLNADLIYSDKLFLVLESLYAEKCHYFEYSDENNVLYKTREQSNKCRSLGARMSKLGYKTLRTRYYQQSDEEIGESGKTINRTVWVLRNYDMYKTMQSTELHLLADKQWQDVTLRYNQKINNQVSFM